MFDVFLPEDVRLGSDDMIAELLWAPEILRSAPWLESWVRGREEVVSLPTTSRDSRLPERGARLAYPLDRKKLELDNCLNHAHKFISNSLYSSFFAENYNHWIKYILPTKFYIQVWRSEVQRIISNTSNIKLSFDNIYITCLFHSSSVIQVIQQILCNLVMAKRETNATKRSFIIFCQG